MKAVFDRIYGNPAYSKIFKWGKLITIASSAQLLIQGISLACGILIIRLLSTKEYAIYTLVNTVLGTMITLADGGIASAVMAQSGRVWNDSDKLGRVIATGFDVRKKFSAFSLAVALPVLIYMLHQHGSGIFMSFIIALSIVPVFYTTLYGHLLEIIPKIRQDIPQLQKIQVTSNILRLITLLPIVIVFPWAFVAVLMTSLSQFWANKKLQKTSLSFTNWKQRPDPIIRKEILSFIKLSLPNAIYFSLSGQILIWLISIFGSTEGIAQVGALGRLALALTVFSALFSTLVSPRFSKLSLKPKALQFYFLQIHGSVIFISAVIVSLVYFLPGPILWILGNKYSNLNNELLLSIIGSCLNLIVGTSISLYTSRGILIKPWISIGVNIIVLLIGSIFINLATVNGILIFNIFQSTIGLLLHFSFGIIMLKKLRT